MTNSKGFSLIEVLVTLLLVTIGLLGMVAMQSRGIQITQDAIQRNNAVELTNQLLDLMRSNSSQVFEEAPPNFPANNRFKNNSMFLKNKSDSFNPAPGTLSATDCLAPSTAQMQRDCWLEDVKNKLPDSSSLLTTQMYVCRSSTPGSCDNNGSTIEIQLAWRVKEDTCPDSNAPDKHTCIYRSRIEL